MRKICPYCRVDVEATEKEYLLLGLDRDEVPDLRLRPRPGLLVVLQTGYLGRTGIFEIMECGDVLRELIFQQISKDVLRKVAVELGMQTLRQGAVDR